MSTKPRHSATLHPPAIAIRLHRLISVTSQLDPSSALPEQNSIVIGDCLQTVEALLNPLNGEHETPRQPGEQGIRRSETKPDAMRETSLSPSNDNSRQLGILSKDLASLTRDLRQRRDESHHIHSLFTNRCEALAQKVRVLGDEVQTLRSDATEADVKLEGLRGTVRGLEKWFSEWQKRQRILVLEGTKSSLHQKDNPRQIDTLHEESSALVEGISAWLRGWKDVDESFQIRAHRVGEPW